MRIGRIRPLASKRCSRLSQLLVANHRVLAHGLCYLVCVEGIASINKDPNAVALFCELQETIVDRLLTCGGLDDPKRLFMSMSQTGQGLECGFQMMRERVADKIDACAQKLVMIACDLPSDSQVVKVKTMTLLGQALIFHVGRHYTQAALNWASINIEEITLLKNVLRQHAVTSLARS